jgi:branched-chain amino acid transport system substrate-binding protein
MRRCARQMISLFAALWSSAALADYKVGFVTSMTGPAATIGVPYSRGIAAAKEMFPTIGGEPVTVIQLDDGSDPSAATRDARKLVEEDKVDLLIGTGTSSSSMAMAAVANELKVPFIAIAPIKAPRADDGAFWALTVTAAAAADGEGRRRSHRPRRRQAARLYRLFRGLGRFRLQRRQGGGEGRRRATRRRRTLRAHRYHRHRASAEDHRASPRASSTAARARKARCRCSRSPTAGYKGKLYGTPALVNADFIRVGGKAVEGILCSGGPVVVADQLPDDHYAKKIALAFTPKGSE